MQRHAATVEEVGGIPDRRAGTRAWAGAPLLITGIMLLALAVRLTNAGREPLWLDEAYTLWFASLPLADLWGRTPAFEPHPPMYYTLLHGWIALFGTSEAALRSMSAVANVAAIPFLYLAGRQLGGVWAGIAAALVFALMPFQLEWSQNARAYAFGALFIAALCWALLWLSARPRLAAVPLRRVHAEPEGRVALAAWATVAVATGSFLWLHNTYPITVFVLQLLALAWWLSLGGRRPGFAVNWITANAVAFLIWAWWVPHLLAMAARLSADGYVIPPPTLANTLSHLSLYFAINDFWRFRSPWAVADLVYFATAAAGALGLLIARRWAPAGLLIGLLALPLSLYLLVSLLAVPAYQPKLMAWTGAPYALLVGYGLSLVPRPGPRAALTALVAAGLFAGVRLDYRAPPREGWDRAAERLAQDWRPGEPVLGISMSAPLALDYYLRRLGADIPLRGTPADWPDEWRGYRSARDADRPAIRAMLGDAPRAWLVARRNSLSSDPDMAVRQEMEAYGRKVGDWDFSGVLVTLYERRAGD
ncbi:MAG TPA: glycosyltransferase family 39 protein [Azospirillaceae bacterium]|nr:glycosyltransferase family 39 protein [Azospirillaceae bacterium]